MTDARNHLRLTEAKKRVTDKYDMAQYSGAFPPSGWAPYAYKIARELESEPCTYLYKNATIGDDGISVVWVIRKRFWLWINF